MTLGSKLMPMQVGVGTRELDFNLSSITPDQWNNLLSVVINITPPSGIIIRNEILRSGIKTNSPPNYARLASCTVMLKEHGAHAVSATLKFASGDWFSQPEPDWMWMFVSGIVEA